jgi:hypothetical protein
VDDDGVLDPLVVPDTLLVVPGFVKDDDGATEPLVVPAPPDVPELDVGEGAGTVVDEPPGVPSRSAEVEEDGVLDPLVVPDSPLVVPDSDTKDDDGATYPLVESAPPDVPEFVADDDGVYVFDSLVVGVVSESVEETKELGDGL